MRKRRMRRGIYLLPTLFTVGNLFCGFAAIVLASRGEMRVGALLILAAGILDGLDGRIARMTGTTSEFGVEFDSLADIVSFGVAPALLVFHWGLAPYGRVGWLIAFFFVVCAAMRLARFNIRKTPDEKRYFAGLPSPPAAATLAAVAFAFPAPAEQTWTRVPVALLTATVALLMISRFRYRSFKELDVRDRRSYIWVLPLAAALIAIVAQPRYAWLGLAFLYVLSAPAMYVLGLLRRQPAAEVQGRVGDESLR